MKQGATVIVGGGLAALMTALFLRKHGESGEIVVVERSPQVGGLLRAQDEGKWGKFDHGMHTFTSTLNPELDELVFGLLPEDEWIWLKDDTRDISGVAFEGTLQKACHYVDLRLLQPDLLRQCVADLFQSLDRPDPESEPTDMEEYSVRRFGKTIANEVISPILEKLYGRPAAMIDPVVAQLLPLDRVSLFSEKTFEGLVDSPLIRERIAYPEQRRLPLKFASGRYSVYPKAFGAYRLVDAAVARLQRERVRILANADSLRVDTHRGRVSKVSLADGSGIVEIGNPKDVYWTA